jgi:TRAP-type mannitol/chloroaromatic compound transport system permease small subunit|tara:strand:- start:424 stop:957 length:534 start_codon:yes stop_codon:yes gene_type:complete
MVMRTLNVCDRLLGLAILFFNGVAAIWLLLMMLAVVSDVLGRFLFNSPIGGTTEIVTMSVVAVLYLQLSYTLRSGGMTRSDAMIRRLIVKRPRSGYTLNIVFFLAGAVLMGAIMSVAWPKWIDAYSSGYYVGVVGVFTFPDWPRLLIVFVGCGLTGLQFLMLAAKDAQKLCNPGSRI